MGGRLLRSRVAVGQRFGRLTVEELVSGGEKGRGALMLRVRCDCGTEKTMGAAKIVSGWTQSCGCLHRERTAKTATTHGMRHDNRYMVWSGIKQRCLNTRSKIYGYYGGRGIRICDEWVDDFARFCADVGERPSLKHSIDRIDNDGNYEPSNVRWATDSVQARNSRRKAKANGLPRGVEKHGGRYRPMISWRDRCYRLGSYDNPADAEREYLAAYDAAIAGTFDPATWSFGIVPAHARVPPAVWRGHKSDLCEGENP